MEHPIITNLQDQLINHHSIAKDLGSYFMVQLIESAFCLNCFSFQMNFMSGVFMLNSHQLYQYSSETNTNCLQILPRELTQVINYPVLSQKHLLQKHETCFHIATGWEVTLSFEQIPTNCSKSKENGFQVGLKLFQIKIPAIKFVSLVKSACIYLNLKYQIIKTKKRTVGIF